MTTDRGFFSAERPTTTVSGRLSDTHTPMTQELSVMEAARDLAGYVERVAAQNEVFTLIRDGRAVAELRPVAVRRTLAELPTIMAGLPGLSPEEATAFEADLDAARAELNGSGPGTR